MTPFSAPGIIQLTPETACSIIISSYFNTTFEEVCKRGRHKDATRIRQAMQTCLSRYSMLSLGDIGRMTNRDHATVLNSKRNVESDEYMKNKYGSDSTLLIIYRRFESHYCGMMNPTRHFRSYKDELINTKVI